METPVPMTSNTFPFPRSSRRSASNRCWDMSGHYEGRKMALREAAASRPHQRVPVLVPRDARLLAFEGLRMSWEASWDDRDTPRRGRASFGKTRRSSGKAQEGSADLPEGSSDLPKGSSDLPEGSSDLPEGSSDLPEGSSYLP